MDRRNAVAAILRKAEASVQAVVKEATDAGAYDEVIELTNIAKSLAEISSMRPGRSMPDTAKAATTQESGVVRGRKSERKGKGRLSGGGYPKFFRRRDDLVKVGWSKKNNSEYEHSAPRRIVTVVIQSLIEAGGDQSLVATERFLQQRTGSGDEIPTYQSYLSLAWLVSENLIQRNGRQGYMVTDAQTVDSKTEESWKQLPAYSSRRG